MDSSSIGPTAALWFGASPRGRSGSSSRFASSWSSLAARLAAESDDQDARGRFAAAIRPILVDEPRRLPEYLCENAAFHEALMALAGNDQLRDLAMRLHLPLIMAQVADILTPDVLSASVREHRAIAEAIVARDAPAAAKRMRAHLERAAVLALARRVAEDVDAAPS